MSGRLQREIPQRKPFLTLQAEAYLNLQRTAAVLIQELAALLRERNLSPAQYNVLRILRGAWPEGLACGEIAERMITRDPDMTRLLDRLEQLGHVTRTRDARDRRVVTTRITDSALVLLAGLDPEVETLHARQLSQLGARRLRQLVELLELARLGRDTSVSGPAGTKEEWG